MHLCEELDSSRDAVISLHVACLIPMSIAALPLSCHFLRSPLPQDSLLSFRSTVQHVSGHLVILLALMI